LNQDHALPGFAQEKESAVTQRSNARERHFAQSLIGCLANTGLQPGLFGVAEHFRNANGYSTETVLELLWIDADAVKSKQAGQRNKARIVGLSGISFQRHVASILCPSLALARNSGHFR
jgi:hypothetical protein